MTTIRALSADDEAAWRRLWLAYLQFYKTEISADTTDELFRRLLTDQRYYARVAEAAGGDVVGITHCTFHPVTWSQRDHCYLHDLFVSDEARGRGVATALIEAVCAESERRGCARVYWLTHQDNLTARRLYDKLATKSDFVQYRRS